MKYGNRSPWKRYVYSPVSLILLLIIFVLLVRATWSIHSKAVASSTRLAQASAELGKMKARQSDLSTKIDKLSSEDGLKSEIRSKYRAVKQGESVAVIIEGDAVASSTATTTQKRGWWSRIWK